MNKFNFELLYKYAKKPALFEKSTASLWDDEHISKGMLKAHLDPETDAASRKPGFIDASVKWIIEYLEIKKGAKILDLGCGPGLYAERLARDGYQVTGIDFSRRSIRYAKEQAVKNSLDICYIYQDYLSINYSNEYDLAILIWCDLGALSNQDRDLILRKAYSSIKPGGYFIFDVFTPVKFSDAKEERNWEYLESGFCRPYPHICLYANNYMYPENDTHLNQHIILDGKENIEVYRLWDHFYSQDSISELMINVGFKEIKCFSDVAGKDYYNLSETLCIVAKK